ncbi:echinoderm microtubule-associated protein-like 5 [Pollicipes pollicipes]|uniref:echinoderm microtubule-associated protein-like 5 n=1 Tax=Pollicipes pollicipes TaxID=41117 RepID=UPI00188582C9|nr:echinoderm microtubule-associated protein-like 5 [Pollicipes pollicipes]
MVALRRSVQVSEDDEADTDNESFPEIYTDVENEQSLHKPSRLTRKQREKRQLVGATREMPEKSSSLNVDTKLPEMGLKLKFAYGYRGHSTRKNLHFSLSGHLVYHLAALGIVYDPTTNGMRFYNHHTDDILCLAMQPGTDVVATGQMGAQPTIHVWSADSLETLSVLKGHHQRAVVCLGLSRQGSTLASIGGDDAHTLVLWNWRSGQKLASARGHSDKVFDLAFDPVNPHRLMTAGVRHVRLWNRSGGGLTWKRGVLGNLDNQDTMLCCTCSEDGVSFSGGASGTVYVWENGRVSRTLKAHRGPLYCITPLQDGYLTGGQDGYICLWDQEFSRCLKIYPISNAYVTGSEVTLSADHPSIRACAMGEGRIVAGTQKGEIVEIAQDGSICVLMSGHSRGELWGLATHPSTLEFATVSDDRTLRLWNRGNGPHVHVAHLRKSARSVAYSSDGSCLAVGFLDGSVSLYSADSLLRAASVHHRDSEISDVKFSPGAVRGHGFLAAASHDDVVDLYHWTEQGQLRRVSVCKDASSYISHVDWLADGRLIRSNSGAGELLYYECPGGRRQLISSSVEPLLDWHTETGVLGPRVAGVWAPEDDLTDINALDRSPDQAVVATACDDGGLIKLFRYPAQEKWCRFRKYMGHSSHVTNVRWTYDGQYLVSVGGADCSVLVWERVQTSEYVPGYTNPLDPDSGDELTVHDLEVAAMVGAATPDGLGEHGVTPRPPHVAGDKVTGLYMQNGEIYTVVTRTSIVGYNIKEGTQVLGIQQDAPVLSCATVSEENSRLLAVGETGNSVSITVIDIAAAAGTIAMLMTPTSSDEEMFNMRFSPSGRFLLCCVHKPGQYILRVWNWKKAIQLAQTEVNGTLLDAAFSPSDDLKMTVICAKQVLFGKIVGAHIQLQKGYIPRKKKGSDRRFLCVACGPDHASYTGTNDGRLLVWKGPIMSQVVDVSQHGPVAAVAVNRAGTALLTAVRSVQSAIKLDRWTTSIAVDWSYSFEVPPTTHLQSVSWAKNHVLVTTIAGDKGHVREVDMKEKSHRELMEVML